MRTESGKRNITYSAVSNETNSRIHATVSTVPLVIGTILAVCIAVAAQLPVYAHEGEDHAAQDLVGTKVTDIERETAENKARISHEKGIEPGAARSSRLGTSDQTFAAVVTDPAVSGSWSMVVETPVIPVFQAVLPNGKVLIWDSVGDKAAEDYPNHTFTRAMVWDPATDTSKRVDVQGYNIFCAGFAHLPNGNILIAGGNADANLQGIVQTHVFNWQTEAWTRGADMAAGRWYPSVATMANGEEVIVGGGPATAEVYGTNGALRSLTGFTNTTYGGREYPFMMSRPDTQLGLFGPYDTTYTLNTAGNGIITGTGVRDGKDRYYGSFATYDIGKHLVVGGGSFTEDGIAKVPSKTTTIVDSNTSPISVATASGQMSSGRRQHNATVLADGSVLATGGMTSTAASGLVDLDHAITAAERWDPATGVWTMLSSASRIRQYHSTAALLPDGRVITGGGGICRVCVDVGYLEKNIEYFTPPYLYKKDGSGALASRPVISTAPATLPINTNFSVTSPQAATIKKVALVGLGDVTRSVDQGQRYVPLAFTAAGTTLTVTGPPSGGVTPPGHYMLFIVDSAGVPSVAKILQVAKGPNPVMSGVRNTGAARCIDVPGSSLTAKTLLQVYTCNGTKAQALSRLPNDNTLRILGYCLDVPSAKLVTGQKIQIYKCNGTKAQTWQFGTDGTIRPMGNTGLCLAVQSSTQKAAVLLVTCSASNLQKWTW